ncbi:MAG: hypothetical protein KDK70_33670, partial [Myxococcales bacterium]|nr:hypothetical protein [Myxococcales bacterium]
MRITDILGMDLSRAELGEDLLEELVGLLLRHEQGQRHPAGEVEGPGTTKAKDGGRDVVVVVMGAPSTPRAAYAESLTWDEVGRTWYSCKSGHTWRRGVDKDLKLEAVRKARKSGKDAPGPRTRRPRLEVLSHVARGHRYVVVTDQRTSDSQSSKLVADLSLAFEFWLRDAQLGVPATLAQQIALIDGNRLAAYLRAHRLRLPTRLREPLGLQDAPGLESWEQWG